MSSLHVDKALNNNVIIAQHPEHGEVVVIGKGIGFNRKPSDHIPLMAVEKMFILTNQQEQEQYKQLLPQVDEALIEIINEVITYIAERTDVPLNEHIHIALTDHISFALKRKEQGIIIQNPFLYETREIYPEEYRMGEYAVRLIKERMGVDLGMDEIGFVALHIYSAMTNQNISQVREHSQLITDLVNLVSDQLDYSFETESLDYSRLLTHLRFALERVRRGDKVEELHKLDSLLKLEYPEMYSLAWKLTKVMEKRLKLPVYPAEVGYLTIHLQRLNQRKEEENK
ncbi:PRD domain-containing protein [Paenibacillus sp. ClWae2A]|uniref:glucose PTS transporter transcription antiterminator GlcT n=1 Tax=Paenibacillus sp. ClWae2A TaxID=3057177 RepID=UPI0028F5970A|nr:PRD domain-containing protein [Paenibacillus sp. ClWae2A]MDT9721504.1 PRD domain-containing protein [Paenibacillus sp. ClWae2A]